MIDKGIDVMVCPDDGGRVDLLYMLKELGARQITSLLVEGGGTVLASFLEKGLVNKIFAFIAPLIIGGKAPTPVGGRGAVYIADAWRLKNLNFSQFGTDTLISGYPIQQEM
jgi:diaminohydroxyphosphoribosylaminopyrimidine deaminase/5-amino-6-(5-phosphoribosylamino)uracil reductase